MVQIHPGPPFHRAGRSIADRRTDIAEAGGATPCAIAQHIIRCGAETASRREPQNRPGAPFINAPVAQCIEHRASNAEVAGESPVGSTIQQIIPGVAQQQRHSAQNGASAGATPAAGTISLP